MDWEVGLRVVSGAGVDDSGREQHVGARHVEPNLRSWAGRVSLRVEDPDVERVPSVLGPQKVLHQVVHSVVGCSGEGEVQVPVQVEVDPCRAVAGVEFQTHLGRDVREARLAVVAEEGGYRRAAREPEQQSGSPSSSKSPHADVRTERSTVRPTSDATSTNPFSRSFR